MALNAAADTILSRALNGHGKPKRIAIIGGGFTGAAVALNLLKIAEAGIAVSIIEPRENLGAGLAYSTPEYCHRTNVPSSRFSILPDEPENLTGWLQQSGALADDPQAVMADGRIFPRRSARPRHFR